MTAAGWPSWSSRAGRRMRSTSRTCNRMRRPQRITSGKEFLYYAQIYDGDLYILTNEDSPRYRVFKTPVTTPTREHWREIIPQTDAVLTSIPSYRRTTLRALRAERALAAAALHDGRQAAGRNRHADAGHDQRRLAANTTAATPSTCSRRSPCRRRSIASTSRQARAQCGTRSRPASTRTSMRPSRSGMRRRTARACRCSWSCAKG